MPEDKAEKLKYDENGWETVGNQFVIDMSCRFSVGHPGPYTAVTKMNVYAGGKVPDKVAGKAVVKKVDGATPDPQKYFKIEPTSIKWNPGSHEGPTKTTGTISLIGPDGSVIGAPVKFEDTVNIR